MIFVYIILCHVKRLCIHQLLYILHYAILCVYILYPHYDIWLCTTTSHTILIYYNNCHYDNSNSYLFLFFIFYYCVVVCVRVCVVLCCLSCVYVCSLVCPRTCSYMCICVCLPRLTLLDCAVVKRLMCWYRGGIFREKIFTKFGKWVYQVKTDRKSILDLEKR